MYHDNLMSMVGKQVEVISSGISYKGRLIEVSETDVYLQGELGWIQLSVETVTEINLADTE